MGQVRLFIFYNFKTAIFSQVNGSISAEHGIGFKKTQFLHLSKSAEAIAQMRLLKNAMDPKNILNPYKVLPLL